MYVETICLTWCLQFYWSSHINRTSFQWFVLIWKINYNNWGLLIKFIWGQKWLWFTTMGTRLKSCIHFILIRTKFNIQIIKWIWLKFDKWLVISFSKCKPNYCKSFFFTVSRQFHIPAVLTPISPFGVNIWIATPEYDWYVCTTFKELHGELTRLYSSFTV